MANTHESTGYYNVSTFNSGTGEYVLGGTFMNASALGMTDDDSDVILADGSSGDGVENPNETFGVFVNGTAYGPGTYTGWMIGGEPLFSYSSTYYLASSTPGLENSAGTATFGTFAYCFLPGTQIATPSGERAIESLQIGDLITTASGVQKPVKWVARMSVPLTRFNRQSMLPICIKQGALGNGVPHRDLFVSNDHAFAIDGLLVIAGALVNGTTIVRCEDFVADVIEYFHVEVEDHDLLLAEGAAAETLCDSNRERFNNAAEFHALYPDAAPGKLMAMGRVTQARQLPKALRSKFFTKVA